MLFRSYTLSLHDALPIRSEERRVGKECSHFKAWIGELHRSHRYTEALDLLGDGSRWFDRPDDRAELSVLRTQTLILAGRVEDAVEFAKRIPLDTDRFREAAFNATQRIMNAGYPEAVLDIAMVYRRAIPDDQELATGIEMLQEHLQSLEDAYYRD